MRVLLAGGVFRLPPEEIRARQPTPEVTLLRGLRLLGIEVDPCPLEDYSRIAMSRGYDIVHVHHLSRGAVAAALSQRSRPFVFTQHAFEAPVSRLHQCALRVIANSASAFICLSNTEGEVKAKRYPRLAPRLSIIPNGIDFPQVSTIKRRWNDRDEFRLLFVGQLIATKQVHRAIKALQDFQQMRLRLVYHNSALEGELKRLARDLRVSERVDFVGQLSGPELIEEYLSAHLLVLPSTPGYECLPSVVTEALLTGLPVVASDVGGISEQIGNAGILFPSTDSSISASIAVALADYAGLAERASQRSGSVRRDYSVDRMITSHISLYQKLLNQ